ncbi:MAG: hypothetical protein ABSG89_04205 [Bacteroidales bacterium]|jgi:hypothetical protein
MKKFLLIGFLMLFVLSATAFAGLTDLKKVSEKPVVTVPKENKLSDEEISHLTKRFEEANNLDKTNLLNKEKNDPNNNSNATRQDHRRHHEYIYITGGGLLLIVLIILLLR